MLKLQTIALSVMAIAGLVCAAGQARAQSTTLSAEPVALTVSNLVNLAHTTTLNFGTFALLADTSGSNTATLTMDPSNGNITPANNAPAQFLAVDTSSATLGHYTIDGAMPTTAMSVSTGNLTNLTCGGCSGTPPAITLTSVTPSSASVTTDGSGDAAFDVGAVLTSVAGGNQYTDGAYAGSFDLTVSY